MFYTKDNDSAGLIYVNSPSNTIICRVMYYDYTSPDKAQEFADKLVDFLNLVQDICENKSHVAIAHIDNQQYLIEQFTNLFTN